MSADKQKRADNDRVESQPEPRRLGCLGSLLLNVVGPFRLVLVIGLGVVVAILLYHFADFMRDPLDNFLSIFGFDDDAEPQVVDSRTIVLNIQDMAMLETVKSGIMITKTVIDSSAAPDAELQVSYIGTVRAGIDFALIGDEDVIVNADGSVTIILPPTQITHCDLGKPEIHRWDCRGFAGLQDCDARRERTEGVAYDRAMEELLETAYELDLLTLATQNAQDTLNALLRQLGHERVQFQQSAEIVAPDESCVVD
jgi:hypothetical protein